MIIATLIVSNWIASRWNQVRHNCQLETYHLCLGTKNFHNCLMETSIERPRGCSTLTFCKYKAPSKLFTIIEKAWTHCIQFQQLQWNLNVPRLLLWLVKGFTQEKCHLSNIYVSCFLSAVFYFLLFIPRFVTHFRTKKLKLMKSVYFQLCC